MKKCIIFLLSAFCFWNFAYAEYKIESFEKPIIVFDFGGVIGNSDRTVIRERLARALHISAEQAAEVFAAYREAKDFKLSMKTFWSNYSRNKGLTLPENWIDQFDEIRRTCILAFPGMLEMVRELRAKGYRVAMLSNVTKSRAKTIREQGFYEPFDPVILSCEIGVSKPKKKAWKVLLKELGGVSADRCIFVDDKQENIRVSKKMGFDGIVFKSADDLRRELGKRGVYVGEFQVKSSSKRKA